MVLELLWESITGDCVRSRTWCAQSSETWERSMIIPGLGSDQILESKCLGFSVLPILFISFTAERPKEDKPPCTGPIFEVEESAKALLHR